MAGRVVADMMAVAEGLVWRREASRIQRSTGDPREEGRGGEQQPLRVLPGCNCRGRAEQGTQI